MMSNIRKQNITLERARKIATDIAIYDMASDVKNKSIPLLQEEYLEAENCWIFFRNRSILIAPERSISDCAYCVSKKGTGRSIPDYSNNSVRLSEYLKIMSDYFGERNL